MTNGRKQLSFILVYAVLQLLVGSGHAQYTTTLEVNLLSELYNSNYSSLVRPSATVMVRTSFVLYTINDLSIVDQTLSISGMLSMCGRFVSTERFQHADENHSKRRDTAGYIRDLQGVM